MYIAMRNRIFELEAKSVNYSPFSHSRKRSLERNGLDDYPDRYAYGYDIDTGHYSKRPTRRYPDTYGHPDEGPPPPTSHRQPTSHPSWYTPEVYSSRPRYPPHHGRPEGSPHCDQDGSESHIGSRPGSPGPNHSSSALLPMRSAYSPPSTSERTRQQPHSGQPPHPSHPHQSVPPPQDRHQPQHSPNGERPSSNMPHNGPYPPNSHPNPSLHHQANHHPPAHPSQHPQHPHPHSSPHHPLSGPPQHQPPPQGYQQQQQQQPHSIQPNGPTGMGHSQPMSAVTPEQRQSIHQQRHRAQQQAQSAHSRSYHLHKHMRLLDQQRAAQMAAQQQQQQHQQHQQQKQQQGQSFKPIQRQYQPHQQMYPSYNQPIAIKPHPGPTQAQLQQQQQLLQKQQTQPQTLAQNPNTRPNPFQLQQQRLTPQQQMMQRYHQQRQFQQKQHQLRQLQYLRNRPAATYPTQKTTTTTSSSALTGGSPGSHSPTPPRVFGPQVDRPIKKSTRPLECSNCMALDSLAWKPKAELQNATPDESNPSGESATAVTGGEGVQGAKILCPACTQYLQTHGKPRPVPPFRTNFLKKIHTRFKRELQEVRFQGWQDAQVLEIEDRMVEREFQMVFNGLDESDVSQIQSRSSSVTGSPAPAAASAATSIMAEPARTGSAADKDSAASTSTPSGAKEAAMTESSNVLESIVIKVEDDDEETVGSLTKSKPVEVRTFQSEASVGELFGHRWRTEPVVGYTLVHFGGSDRTRMVPMNPTVPFLTVKFDRTTESITFAFRVLVNGLCLLSSGGGRGRGRCCS
ncbi:MAG: hypothetical protein JOS17DRAFT_180863 [Linnemannia elongata]|nr:MAG: hypothetical protein JOS17DRAFT_180863 [Linnemannia elongata]